MSKPSSHRTRGRILMRRAGRPDVAAIIAFDHVAEADAARRRFIRESVAGSRAWVATVDGAVAGYAVLEHSFYGQALLAMLYVHPRHRRKGVGEALVRRVESLVNGGKIFTSTNESNRPMQTLLAKLGYVPSGVIYNLDPGDPEIVYFKRLPRRRRRSGR